MSEIISISYLFNNYQHEVCLFCNFSKYGGNMGGILSSIKKIVLDLFVFGHSSNNKDIYKNTITQAPSRIIGGKPAERQQFPYHVSVRWSLPLIGVYSHICGGTLVHESFVLTAAHCEQSVGSYEVGLGLLNSSDDDHPDNEFIKVSKFISHVSYPG